ncbi:SDR family oxidoreductase [Campylobacter coli]
MYRNYQNTDGREIISRLCQHYTWWKYRFYWQNEAEKYPLKKVGQANEVAELIYFLASPKASFITGGLYLIDGGLTAGIPH